MSPLRDHTRRPLTLRALTLNTWSIRGTSRGAQTTSQRLSELCRRLRILAPDVVLLQEVWRKDNDAQIRAEGGYPHVATSDSYRSDWHLESGLVILSRYPLADVQVQRYHQNNARRSTRKAVLFARAQLPGQRHLWLANTHLTSNDDARLGPHLNPAGERMFLGGRSHDPNEPIRAAQLRELVGWIETHTRGPVLVGGDLNTGPQYPLWHRFLSELARDHASLAATLSTPRGLGCTYCNRYAVKGISEGQLDHLVGFRGAHVAHAEVTLKETFQARVRPRLHELLLGLFSRRLRQRSRAFESPVSDHYGVMAELDIDAS